MAPGSDLQKHRQSVQHLSSQMLQTQAGIDALKREQATLEEARTALRKTQGEVKSTIDAAASVSTSRTAAWSSSIVDDIVAQGVDGHPGRNTRSDRVHPFTDIRLLRTQCGRRQGLATP